GMQFVKNYQKNNQGGVDSCSDALVIPILPDPKNYYDPVYDFKYYLLKDQQIFSSSFLYLQVNKNAKSKILTNYNGINISAININLII
ncbi:22036_t:CDS:1, partial [Gigaspora margarita]